MSDNFLGENINFWLELKQSTDTAGTTRLFREIADLRAKVSFYENRIKELDEFRRATDENL